MINESQAEQQYNLRKLLGEYTIEIPPIQRDYAQGRVDDTRVTTIREQFVSTLLDTLQEGDSLGLDFIYGKSFNKELRLNQQKKEEALESLLQPIKKYSEEIDCTITYKITATLNTKESGEKVLILLDGQQRVTTLFLLHWWVGAIAKKDLALLKKFSYKTRSSSTDFCAKLIENANTVIADQENYNSIEENIVDQSWFADSWLADPTVQGMLVMLCEIEKQAKSKALDYENVWANLDKITFDFFDMKEHGLSDELYVKMNARGKHLSDFENFKAWLLKHITKKEYSIANENWETKLDKDWLDLFWRVTSEEKSLELEEQIKVTDSYYLSFFKTMALYGYILRENPKDEEREKQEKKVYELFTINQFVPTQTYEDYELFDEKTINNAFKVLEVLRDKTKLDLLECIVKKYWKFPFTKKDEFKSFKNALLKDFGAKSQPHQVFIFSIVSLMLKKDITESNKAALEQQVRLQRNLIYNQTIQSKENVFDAIQQINEFDYKISSIARLFFATQKQREEEKKKLELLEKDDKWLDAIEKAENHFYLYGQIGFLLDLAKVDDGKYDLKLFEDYYGKIESLLELIEKEKSNEHLLQRYLLAKYDEEQILQKFGDWRQRSRIYSNTHANNRERNENWRNLFKNQKLKEILDDFCGIATGNDNEVRINEARAIINDYVPSMQPNNWKGMLSEKYKACFDYMKKNIIIIGDNEYEVEILKGNDFRSDHTSLYLYMLFLELTKNKETNNWLKTTTVRHDSIKGDTNRKNDNYPWIQLEPEGKPNIWISFLSDTDSARFIIEYLNEEEEVQICEWIPNEEINIYDYIAKAVIRIQEIIENPPNE